MTAFSQKGTDTIPIKQFPIPVVKMIIKDLLSGDSARKQLILTNQQLSQTEKLVSLKDSIINNLEIKEIGSQKIISLERDKFFVLTDHTKEVEKDLKKEKFVCVKTRQCKEYIENNINYSKNWFINKSFTKGQLNLIDKELSELKIFLSDI